MEHEDASLERRIRHLQGKLEACQAEQQENKRELRKYVKAAKELQHHLGEEELRYLVKLKKLFEALEACGAGEACVRRAREAYENSARSVTMLPRP